MIPGTSLDDADALDVALVSGDLRDLGGDDQRRTLVLVRLARLLAAIRAKLGERGVLTEHSVLAIIGRSPRLDARHVDVGDVIGLVDGLLLLDVGRLLTLLVVDRLALLDVDQAALLALRPVALTVLQMDVLNRRRIDGNDRDRLRKLLRDRVHATNRRLRLLVGPVDPLDPLLRGVACVAAAAGLGVEAELNGIAALEPVAVRHLRIAVGPGSPTLGRMRDHLRREKVGLALVRRLQRTSRRGQPLAQVVQHAGRLAQNRCFRHRLNLLENKNRTAATHHESRPHQKSSERSRNANVQRSTTEAAKPQKQRV